MFNFLNTTNTTLNEINPENIQPQTTDLSSVVLKSTNPLSMNTPIIKEIPDLSYNNANNDFHILTLSEPPEKEDFIYLQDKLNRLFGFCMKTQNKKYNIHLCVYSINTECVINYTPFPFLQFLLCKTNLNEKWSFPSFYYDCPIINDITTGSNHDNDFENEDNPPPEQIHFENECFKQLLGLLHTNINFHTNDNNNIMKNMYQGFIEYDDDNLVVVYNFTNNKSLFLPIVIDSQIPLQEVETTFVWKIIDELLYKKQDDLNDMIISFFQKFDYMKNIKSLNGDIISYPFALYLCVYDENNNVNNVLTEQFLITSLEQFHPFFKNGVFFSTYPIQSDSNNLKKYAVFIHNCLYILKDITEFDNEIKQQYTNRIISSSSYYFHDNKVQLWGVKDVLSFVEI